MVSLINQTPMFKWCMARFVVNKNRHQKDMCYDEIGIYVFENY